MHNLRCVDRFNVVFGVAAERIGAAAADYWDGDWRLGEVVVLAGGGLVECARAGLTAANHWDYDRARAVA